MNNYRLLKSGMTLTQIYSQYVSISEQLLIKEEENKKLNSYIDQILQANDFFIIMFSKDLAILLFFFLTGN